MFQFYVHHAADGIGTVDGRGSVRQHLHRLDGGEGDLVYIDKGATAARAGPAVGQATAVEEHEGGEIAQRKLRAAGGGGAAGDVAVGRTEIAAACEAGHARLHDFEEIGTKPGPLDFVAIDDRDRRRDRVGGGGDIGTGDDERFQFHSFFGADDGGRLSAWERLRVGGGRGGEPAGEGGEQQAGGFVRVGHKFAWRLGRIFRLLAGRRRYGGAWAADDDGPGAGFGRGHERSAGEQARHRFERDVVALERLGPHAGGRWAGKEHLLAGLRRKEAERVFCVVRRQIEGTPARVGRIGAETRHAKQRQEPKQAKGVRGTRHVVGSGRSASSGHSTDGAGKSLTEIAGERAGRAATSAGVSIRIRRCRGAGPRRRNRRAGVAGEPRCYRRARCR